MISCQIDDVTWHNILCLIYHSHKDYSHFVKRISNLKVCLLPQPTSPSPFPSGRISRDHPSRPSICWITATRDKYYKYLLGGISAGTIAALGTIAPVGSFQYLCAPQIYHNLGGEPIGIVGTLSNMIGDFSCVYITLGDFKCFPFVEAAASMRKLLKHTDFTPLSSEHLKFT